MTKIATIYKPNKDGFLNLGYQSNGTSQYICICIYRVNTDAYGRIYIYALRISHRLVGGFRQVPYYANSRSVVEPPAGDQPRAPPIISSRALSVLRGVYPAQNDGERRLHHRTYILVPGE